MDEQDRAAIKATRDKALADRQKLDVVIAYLSEQLGEPVPDGPAGGSGGGIATGGDPVAGTHEGEYYSYASTDAAFEVLSRFGSQQRPLKTKMIFDAVKKGGVDIANEDSLYRSLARSNRFRKVGRGLWGLTEWYPNASTDKGKASGTREEEEDFDDSDDVAHNQPSTADVEDDPGAEVA